MEEIMNLIINDEKGRGNVRAIVAFEGVSVDFAIETIRHYMVN